MVRGLTAGLAWVAVGLLAMAGPARAAPDADTSGFTWAVTAFAVKAERRQDMEGETHSITLRLREANGRPITISRMTYATEFAGGTRGEWADARTLDLPAWGEARIPHAAWRPCGASLPRCGPLAAPSRWTMTLEGRDGAGAPVRWAIKVTVPPAPAVLVTKPEPRAVTPEAKAAGMRSRSGGR